MPELEEVQSNTPDASADLPADEPASGQPVEDVQQVPAGDDQGITEEEFEAARENEVAFSWQASEYVHHHKSAGWYMALAGIVAVLVAGAVLMRYWVEVVAFLVMGVAIVVYASKPPRVLMYELTPKGIRIEGRFYAYEGFRSFGVISEAEWHTIDLVPTKRFSPKISVLFDDGDFDEIVGHLELHLSREDERPDVIDRLSRYLRF